MTNFIICVYATENTPYPEIANEYVIPSLQSLNLAYDFQIVPNLGTWQYNTSYKPTFARTMLEKHKDKNVVLLDADARVFQYPELLNLIPEEYNFAAHFLDHNTWYQNGSNFKELVSSCVFLRNCNRTLELVKKWEYKCQNSQLWEQKVLQRLLEAEKESVYNLPLRYCYINTVRGTQEPYVKCDDVVIKQYQASRTTKQHIKEF